MDQFIPLTITLSHSNCELFGITLFLGPFSQAFSVVCSQPNLRTSRLFLSLQSISDCLFRFEYNPFITHWSKNCRERHSQALSSLKVQFNPEKWSLCAQQQSGNSLKTTNDTFHTALVFFGTCHEDTTGLQLYSQIFGVIREHAKSEGKKKG